MTLLNTLTVAGAFVSAIETAKNADTASGRTAQTVSPKRDDVIAPLRAFWKARIA